ncbi:F0F1 ATP synthase subunit delta [Paenibacillus mucilaginosus]|uniref:ATP synthase subunit delta n=3 Tax=Paenibacillus mucilaginosus TaxID=61624 RepID=H6NT24_9BACL|nr:F0F1 ATP synthase subunit delta [Paenibacillus mucilaginosus]AEI38702.1 F0F1 ATP synthase subunit delta [Paenibacillus mucilaginosus KNP414]AFC27037.1 F0F1 ATP synthase subunit delta [Paenibacillus mucilaginosus 3016]AFH59171.1 F0F1 ATP synthase subunit delta [Paenibacillus mucilaginosus K02]MCG7215840.1 F0F1 ATP synthase subunit delta [Paenibacillus mucilaginosus]WDM27789.1 F0F1 ATP synthase subunit delta [Paenibacillus mucilaginosus]
MSQDLIAAKRYAKALFEVAKDAGRIAEVEQELETVVAVFKENPDLSKLIKHPGIDAGVKIGLIKQIFGAGVSESVLNTLQLLIERRREEALEAFVRAYSKIAGESLGQANATVYSPVELSAEELSNIASTFAKMTGKQIRVSTVLDKSLLGGIQVRIGDRLYDGSLSGKLQRLERALNQSQAL